MKHINIYFTLALSLVLFSCKEQQSTDSSIEKDDSIIQLSTEQFSHANMHIGNIQNHDFTTEIALNGHIETSPHNKATIATYYGGYISYSPYLIGDKVTKGQVLIKMKNPDFIELQEQYIKAYEQHKYLEVDYDRQKQLHAKSVIADKDFQEITKDYKSALADLQSLGAQLDLLNVDLNALKEGTISSEISILSPIDGVISSVELNLGVYIPFQSEMMEIVNYSGLHLELDAFEKDLVELKKGQEITFNVVGSDKTFNAELELIGSEVEAEHRTVMIHADIIDHYNLIPGLFVNAKVHANPQQLTALPKEAFIASDNYTYVLILEEQTDSYYRFRKQKVSISRSDRTHSAFDATDLIGDKFLINGGFQLF